MSTKFLCRNCSQIRNRPVKSCCNLFGDGTMHDWVPFTASDDVVGWEDANPIKFNKKAAWIMATIAFLFIFSLSYFYKVGDPASAGAMFGVLGFVAGGFYKQILAIILSISLFFGVCWLLHVFKIVDFSSKPSENPPKVKRVNK
jgi:hypothetical protein